MGEIGVVSLTITNRGPTVDGFVLAVRGLDPAWYTVTQERVALFPGDSLPIIVQLHPWVGATPLAGTHAFEVVAMSEHSSEDATSVTMELRIAGTNDISLKIQPKRIVSRQGDFTVTLTNGGNGECRLMICPTDPDALLVFAFGQARLAAAKLPKLAVAAPIGKTQPIASLANLDSVWVPSGKEASQGSLELTLPPQVGVTIPLHVRTGQRIWRGPLTNIRFEVQARPPGVEWQERDVVKAWGELAYKPYLSWLSNMPLLLRRAQMIALWLLLAILFVLFFTQAKIEGVNAAPVQIVAGQPAVLTWKARFAQNYTLDGTPVGHPNVDGNGKGQMSVMPGVAHIYSLCVSNFGEFILGKNCQPIPIMVLQPTPTPLPPTTTPTTTPTVVPTVPAPVVASANTPVPPQPPPPPLATPVSTFTPTPKPSLPIILPGATSVPAKPAATPVPVRPIATPVPPKPTATRVPPPPTATLPPPPPTNTREPAPTVPPVVAQKPPTETPVPLRPLDGPYGASGAMRWPDWGTFDQPAKALADTGENWAIEDFLMYLIEPQEGQPFQWTATDRLVAALQQQHVNIVGIISYSAGWANRDHPDDTGAREPSFYMPKLDKYDAFVRALVDHYKSSIQYWEVWNEPSEGQFWKPQPNAVDYAALLKTAYPAIKAANPNAKVLNGGMPGNAVAYLEQMVAAGAGDSFDIFAMHTYAQPADPSQGRTQSRPEVHKIAEVELTKYRAFLQRHCTGARPCAPTRPIWVTETGWPAHDWGLDEQTQADYLAQAYAQMFASGLVERVFWYSFKDASASNGDSWGLIGWGAGKTDLSPKRPAYAAYSVSARLIGGAGTRPAGRLQLGPYQVVDDFEAPAAWQARSLNPGGSSGSFAITNEQRHGGGSSGRIQYNFSGLNQGVDFAPPQPEPLAGRPTRLGLWVRGDASGKYLSAWISDRDGELFKVRLGAVTGAADGWRYFESRINNYYFSSEYAGGSPANHVVDYPIKFTAFRLENTPDEPAGGGTIYVDELQSFDGPDASAMRFWRTDGQVVDVLWSVDPTQVNLSTSSASAQVTDRDGTTRTVNAAGGKLPLSVSSSPIYVVHRP